MRDMLFIGHANPEDNDIALWLSLRLASEGYPVWCDLTQLLGGEAFWTDIEAAIRDRTAKYLLVLSKASNRKAGVLDELALARGVQRSEGLQDFIIPLWTDDLPPSEFNVNLVRTNAIPFRDGWHQGLARLLEKLEKDDVPKRPDFGPSAVSSWWRARISGVQSLLPVAEPLATNWYRLRPANLYFHKLGLKLENTAIEFPTEMPYPAERYGEYLVSFARAEDLAPSLGSAVTITDSISRLINPASPEQKPRLWSYKDERATLTKLLNQAWQRMLASRELPLYTFADGPPAFYFTNGMTEKNQVWFVAAHGERTFRNVVGIKTIRRGSDAVTLRYWHFALEARALVTPVVGFTMKPHVLFSDDGASIWESKDRLARARRSQCKNWWNAEWRDRNSAAVSFLAGGGETVSLQVGSSVSLELEATPLQLMSPVSFDESAIDEGIEFALDIPVEDDFDGEEEE